MVGLVVVAVDGMVVLVEQYMGLEMVVVDMFILLPQRLTILKVVC